MFRIENVLPKCPDTPSLWIWSIKLPNGLYELLSTDDEGRGLYIRRLPRLPEECPAHLTRLLSEDEFHVPEKVTNEQSIELLESALNKLGWEGDFIVLLNAFKDRSRSKGNVH